jgi:hypothetical protein
MVEPTGPGGLPGNTTAVEEQQALLAKIQVIKFTANPANVEPFQNTTVSYQVKLPAGLGLPLTFFVGQKTLGHGVEGSGAITITSTTTFQLYVATNLTGRNIASTKVTMDQSQCQQGSIPGIGIVAALKTQIDQSFAGQISGTGSTVTLGAGVISIQIPVNLDGEGTMNIDIELGVALNGKDVAVTDTSVTVKIHLNTVANVDSWCSNAMQQIVQPFMQHITDNEIVTAIHKQIMDQIGDLITSAKQSDPTHRTFALTAFTLTADGASFQVCPE